jgi:hypothetical protein
MRAAIERRVEKGRVPAWREEGIGLEVACLRREEERLSRGSDSAKTKVRVEEGLTNQVGTVERRVRTRGGWVGQDRVRGGIFEREEGIREVIEGVRNACGPCLGDKDVVTAIMEERGGDVETSDAVMVPRLALCGRVVYHHELSGGVDRVGRKIHGRAVQPVPGGEGRV